MRLAIVTPESMGFLFLFLLALGLVIIGGQLYVIVSGRARIRRHVREIVATREQLEKQADALTKAEDELVRLRQVPKAELLSMLQLAHELRSPLASIQSALDVILQGYTRNRIELQDEMLSLARERTATMLGQVNDYLHLGAVRHSEIEGKTQPVQLLEVLERLVPEKRVRARWRAVEFRIEVPDSLPRVNGRYEDMEHLMSNLINNAIKYTNPGGRVTVHLREEDGNVVAAIEDTGIGIAPEETSRIFDEFYRAEAAKEMDIHGTGLGLSIAKRVVDLYGGRIEVRSKPGEGSTFTFSFPIAQPGERPSTRDDGESDLT